MKLPHIFHSWKNVKVLVGKKFLNRKFTDMYDQYRICNVCGICQELDLYGWVTLTEQESKILKEEVFDSGRFYIIKDKE